MSGSHSNEGWIWEIEGTHSNEGWIWEINGNWGNPYPLFICSKWGWYYSAIIHGLIEACVSIFRIYLLLIDWIPTWVGFLNFDIDKFYFSEVIIFILFILFVDIFIYISKENK